jgi:hypothetical protein
LFFIIFAGILPVPFLFFATSLLIQLVSTSSKAFVKLWGEDVFLEEWVGSGLWAKRSASLGKWAMVLE